METKTTIRKRLITQRRGLQPDEALRKSESIRARLWVLREFQAASRVFTYVSAKDHEVDTRTVIAILLNEGREIACPCTATDRRITWRLIESSNDLVAARYGIPEPRDGRPILMPDSDSVVLVPGIAFSRNGDRVGYGAGYFDRFLAECPGISIGLCYDFQIVDRIAVEPHDIPVHIVVTETAAYQSAK